MWGEGRWGEGVWGGGRRVITKSTPSTYPDQVSSGCYFRLSTVTSIPIFPQNQLVPHALPVLCQYSSEYSPYFRNIRAASTLDSVHNYCKCVRVSV